MYDTTHPVYPHLQSIGHEITHRIKPTAIVVFSAHWQATKPGTIEVNISESHPLYYDFYGFPRHYYFEKFQNRGSSEVAEKVAGLLEGHGWEVVREERGLDHGVFVPFKIMFGQGNELDVPIVQVSLGEDENDAEAHLRLGRAVQALRDEGICIVVSGMAVHNLKEYFGRTSASGGSVTEPRPYAVSFDAALTEAVEKKPGSERDEAMLGLLRRQDARKAHPTFEHLLPIHVGVGAAGDDTGKCLWTLPEGSMSWGQYRFGEVVG